MNYQTVQNLLKEIPEISKGLKNNDPEAKKDMNRVIASLTAVTNHNRAAAEGTVNFNSLVNYLSTKSDAISEDMHKTLGEMAILEFAKAFKSEADFLNNTKVKPLEKI